MLPRTVMDKAVSFQQTGVCSSLPLNKMTFEYVIFLAFKLQTFSFYLFMSFSFKTNFYEYKKIA